MSTSGSQILSGAVTPFNSLRLGRASQSIVGRLTRFWDSHNVVKNQFLGITVLLLDQADTMINGFIPANRASQYRPFLKAGSIFKMDRFEVARSGHTYKLTEHQFIIRFIPSTRIVEVHVDAPVIQFDRFMVRPYAHLEVLANTNLELPDVVGEIRAVQGSDLKNETATTRVVVRLLIAADVTVYLSLWDDAAATFRGLLKAGDMTHSVMLVTTVNPKLFGGNMYLNSTQGTRFFFGANISEIAEFVNSVGGTESQSFACVDTLEGIQRKELVSIGDLNAFISNSNEQTQEADFLCKAQIVGVNEENGWSFVSCTACHKKLEKRETSLYCNRCQTSNVTGVVRYRVELAVDDGKDSATFVVFDKEMTKLTKQEASILAQEEGPDGVEEVLPSCLEDLIGREFVFQIRVTSFNFTPNHRTFTVSTLTEHVTTENHGQEHGRNILPSSPGDAELGASSSVPSALGSKDGEEFAGEDRQEIPGGNKKRKRGGE